MALKIDDPETWRHLRNQMREMLAALAEDDAMPDLTACVAEIDRSMAAMRDGGLSPEQSAVMTSLTYMKAVRHVPALWLLLNSIDPLGPALFTSALLMEVLDAQS